VIDGKEKEVSSNRYDIFIDWFIYFRMIFVIEIFWSFMIGFQLPIYNLFVVWKSFIIGIKNQNQTSNIKNQLNQIIKNKLSWIFIWGRRRGWRWTCLWSWKDSCEKSWKRKGILFIKMEGISLWRFNLGTTRTSFLWRIT